jgi:hypothetical protein
MTEAKSTIIKKSSALIPQGEAAGPAVFDIVEKIIKDKDDKGLSYWWKRCYELVRNKFWKQSSDKYVLTTANLIYTHFTRVVNQLTDHEPTFNVVPIGDGVDEQAIDKYDILIKVIDYWWRETEQQDTYDDTVRNGETYGTPIEKYVFNMDLAEGLGDVEVIPVDPFHFGFWPLDAKKPSKCQMMVHYRPMQVSEVRRIWGDAADDVIADKKLIDKMGEERRSVSPMGDKALAGGYSATFSATSKMITGRNGAGTQPDDEDDIVVVADAWIRDWTQDTRKEKDGEGKDIEVSQPKYKGGIRRVVTCNFGEVILEDKDNPSINPELPDDLARKTFLYYNFPFGVGASIKDTTTVYGRTIFEQLYPLQADINVTLTQLKTLKDKSARRKLVNPLTSGVSNGQLTNSAGIINPTNVMEGQGIQWLNDPGIPADLVNHLETLKALFFLVSGSFDMDQAKMGGSNVVAYKAINALLERSAQINRDRQRNYDKLLRTRGRAFLSLAQNWYTEERFFPFEKDGKTYTLKVTGKDLIVPAKLMVVSGSTLPVSVAQRREEAVMLYERGLIDDMEALKRLDYPDYMNVIIRKRQGAYGELMRRLGMIGVPEPMVAAFMELASMDTDKFNAEAKAGKIPPFAAILQSTAGGEDPMKNIDMQKARAEAAEIGAKAQKAQADAQKAIADAERAVSEGKKAEAEIQLILEKMKSEQFMRMVQAEGVKLDWKKMEQEAARIVNEFEMGRKKLDHDKKMESFRAKRQQGPYREKGLKSNNTKEKRP